MTKFQTSISSRMPDMVTWSGEKVWFLEPQHTTICMTDLYEHSRNMCRYNGAAKWSLLQHLALCVELARSSSKHPQHSPKSILLKGYSATHDLHEIITGDVVTGLKRLLPVFKSIEDQWERYVHQSLGLPYEYSPHEKVKQIDLRALVIEMTCLEHPGLAAVQDRGHLSATIGEKMTWVRIAQQSDEKLWRIVTTAINQTAKLIKETY